MISSDQNPEYGVFAEYAEPRARPVGSSGHGVMRHPLISNRDISRFIQCGFIKTDHTEFLRKPESKYNLKFDTALNVGRLA